MCARAECEAELWQYMVHTYRGIGYSGATVNDEGPLGIIIDYYYWSYWCNDVCSANREGDFISWPKAV